MSWRTRSEKNQKERRMISNEYRVCNYKKNKPRIVIQRCQTCHEGDCKFHPDYRDNRSGMPGHSISHKVGIKTRRNKNDSRVKGKQREA